MLEFLLHVIHLRGFFRMPLELLYRTFISQPRLFVLPIGVECRATRSSSPASTAKSRSAITVIFLLRAKSESVWRKKARSFHRHLTRKLYCMAWRVHAPRVLPKRFPKCCAKPKAHSRCCFSRRVS